MAETVTIVVVALPFVIAAYWLCGLIVRTISRRARRVALLNLRHDLNTLYWMSAVKGDPWDQAIKAVREHILEIAEDHRVSVTRKKTSRRRFGDG